MDIGVSREAFKDFYKSFSHITGDLPYGKTVRFLASFSAHFGLFSPMLQLAKEDKTLRLALFNSVAGSKMFKNIIFEAINVRLSLGITKVLFKWSLGKFSFVLWILKPVRKFLTNK